MSVSLELARALRDQYLDSIAQNHPVTMAILKAMPEAKFGYRPHEKCMPFADHLIHIYQTGQVFASLLRPGGSVEPITAPATAAEMITLCQSLHDEFVATLKSLTDDELVNEFNFFGMGNLPGITIMSYYLPHMYHHRGQLQLYLRLAGERCPAVMGPSADVTVQDMMKQAKG